MVLHLEQIYNITLNNFFRSSYLTQMSAIIFFVNFDTILLTRKGLIRPCHEIEVDTVNFLDIFFVELSKFSSGISVSFSLPYTPSFCRLTRISRMKSFSSCQTVFFIMQMLLSNLSVREPARVFLFYFESFFTHGGFKPLNCLRSFFFTILRIDYRLIPVCLTIFLGAKCNSSCEQINFSLKPMFSSVKNSPRLS